MLDIKKYDKISKKIFELYDKYNIQFVTTNIIILELLIYIQQKYLGLIDFNIVFIRKNRVKKELYSKIEGKFNNKKILVIENILINTSILSYINKSIEIENKTIDYVFSIYYNKKIKVDYDFNFFIGKYLNFTYPYIENKKVFIKNKSVNQNKSNLYKKNFIQEYKGKILYLDDIGNIFLLDKKYNIIWSIYIKINLKIGFKPLIIRDYLYNITSEGDLYKIDLSDGRIINKISISDLNYNNIYYDSYYDEIIVFGVNSSINHKYSLIKININSFNYIEMLINGKLSSNIFINKDTLYFGIYDNLLCIYNKKFQLNFNINGTIIGSIKQKGNILYFTTNTGFIYSFDVISNNILNYKRISQFWILSAPLIINKYIYITSVDKKMYILDLDFNLLSFIKTNGRIFSSPKLINNNIITFGSNDSRLYFFNISTKKLIYSQFGERIISNSIFFNNKLVIQDFLNNIYEIII